MNTIATLFLQTSLWVLVWFKVLVSMAIYWYPLVSFLGAMVSMMNTHRRNSLFFWLQVGTLLFLVIVLTPETFLDYYNTKSEKISNAFAIKIQSVMDELANFVDRTGLFHVSEVNGKSCSPFCCAHLGLMNENSVAPYNT